MYQETYGQCNMMAYAIISTLQSYDTTLRSANSYTQICRFPNWRLRKKFFVFPITLLSNNHTCCSKLQNENWGYRYVSQSDIRIGNLDKDTEQIMAVYFLLCFWTYVSAVDVSG